ncbi:MAG: LON peptidase substrate-binding domain-containing protein [Acidobacteria bacterium]|nr:LON peptidase substrate-binding domain-containing protein [Acidobacteriota bacterium]
MRVARLACAAMTVGLLCAPGAGMAQTAGDGALPLSIPLFPLQDVVLFPGVARPLHIFEPRYREMVTDAVQGDGVIGMVLLEPGHEADYEGNPPIFPVGCAGDITEAEELDDGRWIIVLRGSAKFRVVSEDHSRSYRMAAVEAVADPLADDDRAELVSRRPQLAELYSTIAPGSELPPDDVSDEVLVNGLAQLLSLDPLDRQELLEAPGPLARADALLELLDGQGQGQP